MVKKFRGTSGEDVERFLRNVRRGIDRKTQNGHYKSDEEKDEDYVTEIYNNCGVRVQEFLDGLEGEWEVDPDRVCDRLIGRYRTLKTTGWDLGSGKIDSLHQRLHETLGHYIRRALKMTDLCYGKDELYDQLTARFCRGLRGESHKLSLITAMSGLQGQQGRVRFEACIAIAQGMVFATGSRKSNARDSESESSDSDTLSEDSDESSDEDHDRRKKTKPRKKNRKEQKKRRERSHEYGRDLGVGIPVIPGYEAQLEELRKEKEEVRKEKERIQQEKEEAQKEKERVQKEKEEAKKEQEKEEARQEKELARIRMEELQRQLDEMKELKTATRIDQPPYQGQGPLGYGLAQTNLIEAGRPEWTASSDIVCYNCEGIGHYESRCWKPRVHPDVRAENIQRINAETGRRRPFQPRYGQPERRQYVPPERLLEAPRRDQIPQPESQMQREMEELRQQVRDLQRERRPEQGTGEPGTAQLGQGTGSNRQALGSGRAMGREPATSNMIETENVGMLSSALEDMYYEDVLQWEGVDPKQADKRKRPVSDGEAVDRRPQAKRPTLKPVGRATPGRAIPEEELSDRPPVVNPTELPEKSTKKKRRPLKDREPIRMMKGQPKFNTVAALRDTEVKGLTYGQLFLLAPSTRQEVSYGLVQERPPRKGKAKEKLVSLAEPECLVGEAEERSEETFPTDRSRSRKVGQALPESVGRIVNFYTTARVKESGKSHLATGVLKRVLVDGGSVLNMMPLALARRMDLTLRPQTDIVMKTAASTFHEIKYYVNLEVTVAGVTASIRCYCLPEEGGRSSYTLLLGRRWMKQVQALGDYGKDIYYIHDMAGYRYTMEASSVSFQPKEDVPQMCTGMTDSGHDKSRLDEESAEELKLSRNDLCEILYRKIKAQAIESETDEEFDDTDVSDADSESSETDEAEYSDEDSGNGSRHEVPGLRVAATKRRAARLQKN